MVSKIEYLVNTDGYETMIVSLHQSYTDSKRNIFKNGSPIVSGESFRTEITGPFSFPPSDNHQKTNPECLVGEMIFVQGINPSMIGKQSRLFGPKWKMSIYCLSPTHMQSRIYISIKTGKLPLIVLLITRSMFGIFHPCKSHRFIHWCKYCSGYIG